MAKYIKEGDTIEGDAVDIQTRNWIPATIVFHNAVKKRMYRYSANRNSKATITATHVVADDESVIESTMNYHRELGDELECFGMKVYVDNKRRERFTTDEGVTHTHGAMFISTNNHTIAVISTPLACLLKAIAEKENNQINNNIVQAIQ